MANVDKMIALLQESMKKQQQQLEDQREEARIQRKEAQIQREEERVQHQQQMEAQRAQMQQIIDKLAGGSTTSKLQDMLVQVQKFEHDPERGLTIEPWLLRFETIFASDEGTTFSDADKLAVLFGRLSSTDYNRLADTISPGKPETLVLADVKKHLEKLFGRKESCFSRGYKTMRITKRDDEDFGSYTARINKAAQDFDFASFKIEDFKNQLFVQGLKSAQDAVILKKALEKLNDHQDRIDAADDPNTIPKLTIDDLRLFAERQELITKDRNTLDDTSAVTPPPRQARQHPSSNSGLPSCHYCNDKHMHRNCPFKEMTCSDCKKKGHKKGFCESAKKFNELMAKKHPDSEFWRHKIDWASATKSARKYVRLFINGKQVSLKLDSGSD